MPFKSEKQRKWMHANEPEMAKKWEKKEKKMKRVKELIKKMVREELTEMTEGKLTELTKFTPAHIKQLQKAFKNAKGILPDSNPLMVRLNKMLMGVDRKNLELIAKSDINILSPIAKKRLGMKEGKLNEAKETIFDVAARVMKDSQMYNYKSKKGMVKVDMQTANLLTKVFKKVNPKMKKILSDLGEKNPAGLMNTLWAVVK